MFLWERSNVCFELQDWVSVTANFNEINSSWSTISYGVKTRQTTVLIVFSVKSLLFAFIAIGFSYIFRIWWMYDARYWTDKRLFQWRLAQCARFNRVNFVSVCFVCWLVAHYGNVMHQWKELRKRVLTYVPFILAYIFNHIVVMRYNFEIFMDFDYLCRRFSILLNWTCQGILYEHHGKYVCIISGQGSMLFIIP